MRLLLRIIFRTYMFSGIVFIISVFSFILFFLASKSVFYLNDVDPNNDLFTTFINILIELWPAIIGTSLVTLFSVLLATPFGIITGVFINEYTTGKIQSFYIFLFKILAGIPSIVIGVLGFTVIISLNNLFGLNLRTSLLISSITVAILILPYIVHSTIISLNSIPVNIRIASLSLGAKKYQNIFRVLLPESFISISSGIVLAIGRAAEDTAVIMLTGAAAYAGIPNSLFDSFEALPFYIYYHTSEYQDRYELTGVFIAALIIIFISIFFMLLSKYLNKKLHEKLTNQKR